MPGTCPAGASVEKPGHRRGAGTQRRRGPAGATPRLSTCFALVGSARWTAGPSPPGEARRWRCPSLHFGPAPPLAPPTARSFRRRSGPAPSLARWPRGWEPQRRPSLRAAQRGRKSVRRSESVRRRPVSGFVARSEPRAVHGEGEWARRARTRDRAAYALLGSGGGTAGRPSRPAASGTAGESGWRERLGDAVGAWRGGWSSCGRRGPRRREARGRVLQARPRSAVLAAGSSRGLPPGSRPAPRGVTPSRGTAASRSSFPPFGPVEDPTLAAAASGAVPGRGGLSASPSSGCRSACCPPLGTGVPAGRGGSRLPGSAARDAQPGPPPTSHFRSQKLPREAAAQSDLGE